MNPEEYYNKNNPVSDKDIEYCLRNSGCFDEFVDMLKENNIATDEASDIWDEYWSKF